MSEEEQLKKILRFDGVEHLFKAEGNQWDYSYPDDEYSVTYKPTYQDLVAACENMLKADVDIDTIFNWYGYVSEEIDDCYDGALSLMHTGNFFWVEDEEELILSMSNAFDDLTFDVRNCSQEWVREQLADMIHMAEYYEFNRKHEVSKWKYTKEQREMIYFTFADSISDVPDEKIDLLRRLVDEGCAENDPAAMRIKGYSCYGGDRLYECDWDEACRIFEKLYEETSDAIYANTLGYIYYYGRCNGGVPEYGKAFEFFTVGALHGIVESRYKLADMFLDGKGCKQSEGTAAYMINALYNEVKPRYCDGEDLKFADVALRMGAIYERRENYEAALGKYLEADYAIKLRRKMLDYYGDVKVQENISQGIERVKSKLPENYFRDELVPEYPYWLTMIFNLKDLVKLEIRDIGKGRYRFRFVSIDEEHRFLIASSELEAVTLANVFECEVRTEKPLEFMDENKEFIELYGFAHIDRNSYEFGMADLSTGLIVRDAEFVLRKSDFEEAEKSNGLYGKIHVE
ncbi:MAG: sel1 repeat family protein [Lachnospiraceae bacterium]|nr:sel1 repeat family protein [Lachnospiraceae bacterium]